MRFWSLACACLMGALAVGAPGESVRPHARQISFARGKWNPADFIPVKSWRNKYVGSFDQRDDAIVNACSDLPGEEIFKKHCSDVYAALELPKGMEFKKDKVYDLVVKTRFNARGRREMVVQCDGYTLSYVDDALPTEFYAGIIGCEGRNFFYDFRVDSSGVLK